MTALTKRILAIALIPALISFAASFVFLTPGIVGFLDDDGVYVMTAKSLATDQGYRLIGHPGEPRQTKYPILYPAFLSALWRINPAFPENLALLQIASMAVAAISIAAAVLYLVRFGYCSPAVAFATALLCGTSPFLLIVHSSLLSEGLFALLLIGALWAAEPKTPVPVARWRAFAAGFAAGIPALCRTMGLAVVPAVVVSALARRSIVRWSVVGALIPIAFVVLPMITARGEWSRDPTTGYFTDYAGWFAGILPIFLPVFIKNLVSIAGFMAQLGVEQLYMAIDAVTGFAAVTSVLRVLCVVAALVTIARWIRQGRPLGAALAMLLLVLCAWPFPAHRLIVPILVPLTAAGFSAIAAACGGRARRVSQFALSAVVLAAAAFNLSRIAKVAEVRAATPLQFETTSESPVEWRSFEEIHAWIAEHHGGETCASFFAPLTYLYSGCKTICPYITHARANYDRDVSVVGTLDEFTDSLRTHGARYLVQTPAPFRAKMYEASQGLIEAFITRSPGALVPVYRGTDPRFVVYRLDNPR